MQTGDLAAFKGIFVEHVVSVTDGGGMAGAARVPVVGRERVAKYIAALPSHFWAKATFSTMQLNGQPFGLIARDGVAIALVTVDASPQGIDQVLWIRNPAKLAAISKSLQASSQS